MNSYRIVVLPGDGVGPEVMTQAMRILELIEDSGVCRFQLDSIPCAGSYYSEYGKEWADGSFEECKAADAIMLGAIGHMGPDGKPVRRADGELAGYEQVIGLRMKLDLYANLRPIKLYPGVDQLVSGEYVNVWKPENVDLVVFRENTEGAYVKGSVTIDRGERVESVMSPNIITRHGAERVIRRAFELASKHRSGAPRDGVKRVTCVEKSNVLHAHRFFRDIFREIGADYPAIEQDFGYVDSFCHNFVRAPEAFDVIVAPNLPGDIITDLGAAMQGGMGMAASGNIGDNHAMFEPVHGSAPDIAGREIANPAASVLSVSLMLNWLGEKHGDSRLISTAAEVEAAVAASLADGEAKTKDLGGDVTTSAACTAYLERLKPRLA